MIGGWWLGAGGRGAAVLLLALATPLGAQRREQRSGGNAGYLPNVPYDGRFTLARIRYAPLGGPQGWFEGHPDVKWDHDYPRSERHFAKILNELTTIQVRMDASNIFTTDDPEFFKFTMAYLCEVGFWAPNEKEILGLRSWLQKGGFLLVDDFVGPQWYNFATQMEKVLPGARLVQLTKDHPIFDSFYRIESLEYNHPYFGVASQFFGIFEDNDPAKRLIAIVNYNNDISEYWEWSDTGIFPIDLSNEAYKLGVNYVVYAMTR